MNELIWFKHNGCACFSCVEKRYYVWIRQIHKSRPKRRCIYRIHQVKITIPRSHNGFFLSPVAQWFFWKYNKALWYIHLKKTMVFWSRKKKSKKYEPIKNFGIQAKTFKCTSNNFLYQISQTTNPEKKTWNSMNLLCAPW